MSEKEGKEASGPATLQNPQAQQQTEVVVDDSRDAAVVLQFLPSHGDARGSDPRLRPESSAVRHGPAGRQGKSADRDEFLHGQTALDGPRA